jgi:uncharacterized protein YacL
MLKPIILARILFIVLAGACGFWVSRIDGAGGGSNSAIAAFIVAAMVVLFEYSLRTVAPRRVFLASLGLLYGLIISALLFDTIPESIMRKETARIVSNFLFGYLGLIIALKHADQFNLESLRLLFSRPTTTAHPYILDTSVIIDGRVREVILSGFMPAAIIVPTFVIDELQLLADSADSFKRAKGRRGLTMLEDLQSEYSGLQILEKDYPQIREVDRKLLELGKEINGRVVTNDYNLQKVASLHKVAVLNINELADMLKPAVFVGETFPIQMVREGKEQNQGVGYLQDGTMVVVDDGQRWLGKEIEVVVTSLLQTNTGRMVFARTISSHSEGGNNR